MINLGKLREDQLEPAERERLIVDGQDPYRHPAYPSGNSSVARKQEADGRSVDNFAAAPKRLDSRSRTLRRPVCVPQMPGRDADDEQLFSTTTFNWPRSSRAAIAIQAPPAPTVPAPCRSEGRRGGKGVGRPFR